MGKTDLGISIKLTDLASPIVKKIEASLTGMASKLASVSKSSTSAADKQKASLSALVNATDKNTAANKKMSGSLKDVEGKLNRVKKLTEALTNKKNTLKLDDSQLSAIDTKLQKLNKLSNSLQNKINNTSRGSIGDRLLGAAKLGVGGAGLLLAGRNLNNRLSNYRDQYADLAKSQGELMTLGVDRPGMEAITAKGVEFTNKYSGMTTKEFVSAAYDIKSGISSLSDTGVGEMTRISALTAKATKSSVEQMTSLFATGYNIYSKQFDEFASRTVAGWKNLSQEEKDIKFGEVFSAGLSKAVQMYKTKGSEMEGYIGQLGAAATNSGRSLAEQFAIGGILQSTMSGSEAATKYKAFLRGAGSAGGELGLKFVDKNNNLLSAVEILDTLRKKYGNVLDAMEKIELQKAFGGDEAIAFIDLLYNKTDMLKQGVIDLEKAQKRGLKLTTGMAEATDFGQESERLKGQLSNLASTIGQTLAPAMGAMADVLGPVVTGLQSFTKEHPIAASVVGTSLTVFALGATALGALGIMAGAVAAGLAAIGISGSSAAAGMIGAAGAATTLQSSLLGLLRLAGPLITFGAILAGLGIAAGDNQMLNRSSGKSIDQLISDKNSIQGLIDSKKNGGISGAYASLTDTRSISQLEKLKAKKDKDIANAQKQEADKALAKYNLEKSLSSLNKQDFEKSAYIPSEKGKGTKAGKYGLKQHAEDLIKNNALKTKELGDRLTTPCSISPANSWGEKTGASRSSGPFTVTSLLDRFIGIDNIPKAINVPKDIFSPIGHPIMTVKDGDIHININGYQKDARELANEIERMLRDKKQSKLDRSMYS